MTQWTIILFLTAALASNVVYGKVMPTSKDSLNAEKINKRKIVGNYHRQEPYCSRAFKIKRNHRIVYKGGCERNKDTRSTGKWVIENDTIIVTGLFDERQTWILVNGCLYEIKSTDNRLIGCKKQTKN